MSPLEILCREFSQITGAELDLNRGPVRLDIGPFGPWWLEADRSQCTLTIHHSVGQARPDEFAHWLEVNCQLPLMGGAWLAYHRPTESIRLCLLVEIVQLDKHLLINLLENLQCLRANLPMPLV